MLKQPVFVEIKFITPLITEEALNALDFINLMVYDYTGPWNPSPGQHSSYNHAKRGIHFWKNKVGINPSKLTLGVPFYGYDFQNSTTVESFTCLLYTSDAADE